MTRGNQICVDGDSKELTQSLRDGKNNLKTGVVGEDDEVKCNGVAEEVKVGEGGNGESSSVQQQVPQYQSQGAIICWERFLHIRSLKVLLVEYDDCTRHIVTALLRNCSYEVIEAANGLQAWKILEDLTNHIDIVLTEVAMPGLSGIALLYKIMDHTTRKNIPVIMMSSHDSMGLVFKCLSKGAVDFLVKPIRKNELKNLWQHVWRRCHSSSWTKRAVEVDSPKSGSQWDQIAECPDSTCAQVVHSNAEICRGKVVPPVIKECPEQKEQIGPSKFNDQINRGQQELNCENQSGKLRCKGLSLSDGVTSTSGSQMRSGETEALNRIPKSSDIYNKGTNNDEELPSLELSLKRPREVKEAGTTSQDERNVLRRSDLSAFSKYNAALNAKKSPTGCVGSNSSPHNNSLEVTKKDSSLDVQSHSSGNPPNQNSNGGSNNIDMGSTTNNAFTKSAVISEPAVASTTKFVYKTSAFQPIKSSLMRTSQQVVLHNNEYTTIAMLAPPKIDTNKGSATQDFHYHYENHNNVTNMQHQLPPENDAESLKKMTAVAPHCGGSSNVVEVLVEGNMGNYSINRSASGSNIESNGQNGSSTAINAGGTNIESNNGLAGNSGSGDASGNGSANRVDQNKNSQREAALTKFRQKRKERKEKCFHKQVRYQSRKKLAEQRPRYRGQFVRQSSNNNASEATDS
ncbi:two-component response regulator-like APRR7 isoform X3 [Lathyrus oleraceus]|uniref:two-component response regulator-like APRR7 isoform X3 n=1 Tax=Pisum sativum TaxID=3888 RepID=UPI0021D04EA2|nr:two-component response regulator-like APRR7 isoform X3 [Pisum sativum]